MLPMWGALDKSYSYYSCFDVSIHAPVWGTRKLAVVDSRLKKFQLFYVNSTFIHFAVSIHVLRIVSTFDSGKCCYAIAFQFILSRMESTSPMAMQQILTWFQFTLPAWVAHYFDKCVSRSDVFQFTLPVWGAFTPLPCTTFIIKFQFTLPGWGALSTQRRIIENLRFNSRTPDGEHMTKLVWSEDGGVSIHAPIVLSENI